MGRFLPRLHRQTQALIFHRHYQMQARCLLRCFTTPPPKQPPVTVTILVQNTWTQLVPMCATAAATAATARSGDYDRVMRNQTLRSVPKSATPRLVMAVLGSGGESATRILQLANYGWHTPPPPQFQPGPATLTIITSRLSPMSAPMSSGCGGESRTTRASDLIRTAAEGDPLTQRVLIAQ